MRAFFSVVVCLLALPRLAAGEGPDVRQLVGQVVHAAGGEEKLLDLFRFRERVVLGDVPPPALTAEERGNRESVVRAGGDWWIGTTKRDKDKVRVLAWAWTLQILLDPKSIIEAIEGAKVSGQPTFGLRVTEAAAEPVDLFFDLDDQRLVAIDYDDTRHLFSEWKETADGRRYASRAVGFRFVDRAAGTLAEKQWYQSDIIEVTPLAELPAELRP